jgi:hypothetical protein
MYVCMYVCAYVYEVPCVSIYGSPYQDACFPQQIYGIKVGRFPATSRGCINWETKEIARADQTLLISDLGLLGNSDERDLDTFDHRYWLAACLCTRIRGDCMYLIVPRARPHVHVLSFLYSPLENLNSLDRSSPGNRNSKIIY